MLRFRFFQLQSSIFIHNPQKIILSQTHPLVSFRKLRSQMGSYSTASSQSQQPSKLLFRQLFEKESSTYTYLLADATHPEKPALVLIN